MHKVAGPSYQSPARRISTGILADKETSPLEIRRLKNLMKDNNNDTGDSLITKKVERNEVLVKVKSGAIMKLCASCAHKNKDITVKIVGKSDGQRKPAKKAETKNKRVAKKVGNETLTSSNVNDAEIEKKPGKIAKSRKTKKNVSIDNDTTLEANKSNNAMEQINNNTENQSDTSKSVKKRGTATAKKAKNEDISQKQTNTKVKKPNTSVKNSLQKKKTTLKPSTAEEHSDNAMPKNRICLKKALNSSSERKLQMEMKNFRNQDKTHVSTDDSMKKEKTLSKQKMNKKCKKENRQRKTDLKVAKVLEKSSQYFSTNSVKNIVGCTLLDHMSSSSSESSDSSECNCWVCSTASSRENSSDDSSESSEDHFKRKSCRYDLRNRSALHK